MKKLKVNWYLVIFLSIILISGLILTWFIRELYQSEYKANLLNVEVTTMIGTFIAGTVGVLFSAGSAVIFYGALSYQRKELKQIKGSNDTQILLNLYFELFKKFNEIRSKLNNVDPVYINIAPLENIPIRQIRQTISFEDDKIIFRYKFLSDKNKALLFQFCETYFSLVDCCKKIEIVRWGIQENDKFLDCEEIIVNTLSDEEMFLIDVYGKTVRTKHKKYFLESIPWLNRTQLELTLNLDDELVIY